MVLNRENLLLPTLFSVDQTDQKDVKARLTVQGQYCWSSPFSINVQGVEGECIVSGANTRERERRYAISISHAPGAFGRTRVITITPRYLLFNETSHVVKVDQ